ncbi:hypothetical protein [Micromonospora sp. NPDC005189]|uniref:hypothetical protein n=1 Tax=unclassified Micromonospora TaxID=2617518 RepID=UPI0033B37BA3
MTELVAPQLVVNNRMLYFGWLPADPDAVAALVPDGLTPAPNHQVFMNQYVVDDAGQTSGSRHTAVVGGRATVVQATHSNHEQNQLTVRTVPGAARPQRN